MVCPARSGGGMKTSQTKSKEADLILRFGDLDRGALSVVGGKAANLGELTRAGLPVPPGFCVTTAAYALVARDAGLAPTLAALAATAPDDLTNLASSAADARAALLATPIPAAIETAIIAGYVVLGADAEVPV